MTDELEIATLAGGCFWCLEAVYQEVEGVEEVVSGYTGGSVADPTYRQVCSGETGHAEVVQVHFDPARISYRRILEIFFAIHDPTTMNAQGADVGTQYRSAIYVHSPEQRAAAEALVEELEAERLFDDPIVTEIEDSVEFYPAEDYHQNYYRDNSSQPYCRAVITPKLAKFRQKFLAPQAR
ncbi:MAG TPA: peptide-methionine (S)-S-oxide reductase MsrA [Thermoanaerobaculia bacterium]|nr:peptide-methionine (S)-S-oxide reductase MsrA [Thermoanaerobaculia bacterium]